MKNPTNEQRLKNLIKENDTYTNALLVERLLLIIEATAKELEENPESFNTFVTSAGMYQNLVNNVRKHFPALY
jgi:hypothetical protein